MKNFDIFISHKHTDGNGNLTEDYYIAKNLYDVLVKMGYSVFLSSSSLEELASSRYKADIDNALDNAKLMIVVLTREEYALSQWVQYEWDSFYNDYLSGNRDSANLYTLTKGVNIHNLPRTLRNVQNFVYEGDVNPVCSYIGNAVPIPETPSVEKSVKAAAKEKFRVISGKEVTRTDIEQAMALDDIVYAPIFRVDNVEVCLKWFKANPDIYVMVRDISADKIIAYVNTAPVADEYFEQLKSGSIIDSTIPAEMILSYDMPGPYNLYVTSIVIHPDYQNTEVFMMIFNALIKKFIALGEHEVYIERMLADAVTDSGNKFCRLFGMKKVKNTAHNSTLYEVSMIPPEFRVLSKSTKELYDCYEQKYKDEPYLFEHKD